MTEQNKGIDSVVDWLNERIDYYNKRDRESDMSNKPEATYIEIDGEVIYDAHKESDVTHIITHNDGKEKHGSWEARTTFKVIGGYGFEHEIEIECFGRSEKDAVGGLMDLVAKTEQAIKEKIASIRQEYESNNYDETDVTLNRYLY